MKRLGYFTGKIYDESIDTATIQECCLSLTEEQAKDEDFIQKKNFENKMKCITCFGCPISQKSIV